MDIFTPLESGGQSPRSTFKHLEATSFTALDKLIQPVVEQCELGQRVLVSPTDADLEHARAVGKTWWKIHTSVVLLTPRQREKASQFIPRTPR